MPAVLVLNGPNLNLLGTREPGIYGALTLAQILERVREHAARSYPGVALADYQSNSEGSLVDAIQNARDKFSGIVINPAAYTHTSVAIRDALAAYAKPVVEVHLSNIFSREPFRHVSYVSPVAAGTISGFGWHGYILALDALMHLINGEGTAA